MNIKDIQEHISSYSKQTENIFVNLAEKFPALLNKDESSALNHLLSMFNTLDTMNKSVTELEKGFFSSYDQKYQPLFESLNKKIEDLSNVNNNVKKIKDNSEEMELIALNAMVISIKSGERGRAFSSITESLKQLSTDMNIYSNKLLEEEQQLLKQIHTLKEVFDGIMNSQRNLSNAGSTSSTDVSNLIQKASAPLNEIKDIINSVYPPIQSAMEGLQLQDIIRQAMDSILLCLNECTQIEHVSEINDTVLDNITFNIALLKLSTSVLEDICKNIKKSIDIFKNNWDTVSNTLNQVEPKRSSYVNKFLDKQNLDSDNIYANMTKINGHFSEILTQFGVYQANQKNLERNCNVINEKAHQMYAVFEALKPIIDRLHHVRILQQIEVAKNPAISAVKDSVIDMDNLISSANDSLDEMQEMLTEFIAGIKSLLEEFTKATRTDSLEMNKIRIEKNSFFQEFRNVQDKLTMIMNSFNVFPAGFEQQYISVQNNLNTLSEIYDNLRKMIVTIAEESMKLETRKMQYLERLNITSWELKDDRLKNLVKHFTITAHKEEAGQIGNFGVEDGIESGEITFF